MAPGDKKVKKPLHEYPAKTFGGTLHHYVGHDSLRRNGFHCIADNVAITAAGNVVQFVNYQTGVEESFSGPEGGGIGSVCVHPTRKYFVVCEKAPKNPRVVVYEYPSKKQAYVLNGGATLGFTACTFNQSGTYLATVAMEPDYTLTIWNWKEQKTVLRNKAFGSDVYTISFSPFNEGMLVSSGLGHIKFWTMAETFTGLKLQGSVGKFGRLEISDVTGYTTFPDNKVVSGSESGSLLLWEGNLVKCELVRELRDGETATYGADFNRCHENGNVEVVDLIEKGRIVMSGGSDGYVRYWTFAQIDVAETNGVDVHSIIKCQKEYFVGEGVRIKSMSLSVNGDHWVILDAAGSVRRIPYWSYDTIVGEVAPLAKPAPALLSFHSGAIRTSRSSPTDNTVVTGGDDGTLRLMDFIEKKEYYRLQLDAPVIRIEFYPPQVDPSGTLFIAGFQDGSIRTLRKGRTQFFVINAWRPHSASLISFALDKAAKQLYTVAKDGTAFYFTVDGGNLKPIGYCRLPGSAHRPPQCLEWDGAGTGCFFGYVNGNILHVKPPVVDSIDHEIGYEFEAVFSGVGYRQKQKPPEKSKKVLPNGEIEESSSDDEDLDEVDNGPWAVQCIRRLPDDTFLVALKKEELAYQYHLTTQYDGQEGPPPIPATGIDPPGRVEEPIQNLCFRDTVPLECQVSYSGENISIICENSVVLTRPWKGIANVMHAAQIHDGIDGLVTAASFTFDDRALITSGLDGLLVSQTIGSVAAAELVKANITTYPEFADERHIAAEPIVNSIQKQKEEDDRHRAEEAALGKKQQLLRKIHLIHKEYLAILDKNANAVGGMRLTDEEIQLDPQLLEDLSSEKVQRVETARLDYTWTSAKKETLLKKLRAAYVDNLVFDRFLVRAFESSTAVSSFRTPHFTEGQQEGMKLLNAQLALAEDRSDNGSPLGGDNPIGGGRSGSPTTGADGSSTGSPNRNGSFRGSPGGGSRVHSPATAGHGQDFEGTLAKTNASQQHNQTLNKSAAKSQLEKAEERKLERSVRKQGYDELHSRKPRGTDDDARSATEVGQLEAHMGDYVLKTSPKYIIPNRDRPTAERKSRQLLLLEHSINRLRTEFNFRLIGLRDLKRRLCDDINADRARVREIAARLKLEGADIPVVALAPEEEPEKRFDIDREGLDIFEKEQEKERRKAEAAARAKKGFGSDLATMEEDKDDEGGAGGAAGKDGEESSKRQSTRESLRKPSHAPGPISTKEKLEMDMRYKMENLRLTEIEEEEQSMERELLQFEKARLERRIASTISSFDEKLNDFYQERMKLEADLSMADMRVILLFREYQLLQLFKKKDIDLQVKLEDREKEKRVIGDKSKVCVEKVNNLTQRSQALQKRLSDVLQQGDHFIAEKLPADAKDYLTKIFYRKVKRRKEADNDEDDDDDVTSDDDDDEQQEDDGDDGIEEEVCPPSCEPELWDELLALRARKLECDYETQDIQKIILQIRKEASDLKNQDTQVQNAINGCEKDIASFQVEKLKQLNLLETIVVLKLSQIQCLTAQRKLPFSLNRDDIVVFTQSGLDRLRGRIHELADLKSQDRKENHRLAQEKQKLFRKKSKRQAEHGDWEARVQEVQLLKFGQRIDLEKLENIAIDRETEELKEALRVEELKWERELSKYDEKLDGLRQDSQQRVIENTALLKDLGALRGQQHDLEHALIESTQTVVAKMTGGSRVATSADRANLKDLVVAQQHELDALKAEIAMLRRKGGHVYTPVVQQGQAYK